MKELNENLVDEVKGECVIVIKGNTEAKKELSDDELKKLIKKSLKEGKTLSEAVKELQKDTGVKKNRLYQIGLTVK